VSESDRLISTAEQRFAAGDHDGAIALLQEARQMLPPNPRVDMSLIEMHIALDCIDEGDDAGRRGVLKVFEMLGGVENWSTATAARCSMLCIDPFKTQRKGGRRPPLLLHNEELLFGFKHCQQLLGGQVAGE
jgi:hypothetical protein